MSVKGALVLITFADARNAMSQKGSFPDVQEPYITESLKLNLMRSPSATCTLPHAEESECIKFNLDFLRRTRNTRCKKFKIKFNASTFRDVYPTSRREKGT